MSKRRSTWIEGALLAGLLIVGSVPSAVAWDATPVPSEQVEIVEERAIGVLGAMLCGAEGWLIRTNPVLGMNPYCLAAGIAGCLAALIDVATT